MTKDDFYKELRSMAPAFGACPIGKFVEQKNKMIRRGADWQLTLQQWWEIWQESGHWNERGKEAHNYVLARIDTSGPYSVDNVRVRRQNEKLMRERDAAHYWLTGMNSN